MAQLAKFINRESVRDGLQMMHVAGKPRKYDKIGFSEWDDGAATSSSYLNL